MCLKIIINIIFDELFFQKMAVQALQDWEELELKRLDGT